jgi:hypothetical protein
VASGSGGVWGWAREAWMLPNGHGHIDIVPRRQKVPIEIRTYHRQTFCKKQKNTRMAFVKRFSESGKSSSRSKEQIISKNSYSSFGIPPS